MYKAGQRTQWSSHRGTELELGTVSSRIMVSSITSIIFIIVIIIITSGEHGGDVSAGSPGSPGHSGGHLRLGAYTGLHPQEVGWSLIEQTQLYV